MTEEERRELWQEKTRAFIMSKLVARNMPLWIEVPAQKNPLVEQPNTFAANWPAMMETPNSLVRKLMDYRRWWAQTRLREEQLQEAVKELMNRRIPIKAQKEAEEGWAESAPMSMEGLEEEVRYQRKQAAYARERLHQTRQENEKLRKYCDNLEEAILRLVKTEPNISVNTFMDLMKVFTKQ